MEVTEVAAARAAAYGRLCSSHGAGFLNVVGFYLLGAAVAVVGLVLAGANGVGWYALPGVGLGAVLAYHGRQNSRTALRLYESGMTFDGPGGRWKCDYGRVASLRLEGALHSLNLFVDTTTGESHLARGLANPAWVRHDILVLAARAAEGRIAGPGGPAGHAVPRAGAAAGAARPDAPPDAAELGGLVQSFGPRLGPLLFCGVFVAALVGFGPASFLFDRDAGRALFMSAVMGSVGLFIFLFLVLPAATTRLEVREGGVALRRLGRVRWRGRYSEVARAFRTAGAEAGLTLAMADGTVRQVPILRDGDVAFELISGRLQR